MNLFTDSSALAKRYFDEPGSDRIEELFRVADAIAVSVICTPEVLSALNRRRRDGSMTGERYRQAKERLITEVADATVIALPEEIIRKSIELLERWPLRAADALHVASAAIWGADLFVSSDRRQCAAAKEYGLAVEELPG